MKYRIAKKILTARHWTERWSAMRPMYRDEQTGHGVQPSWHDIPDPRFQKARRRFYGYWRKASKKEE